MNTPDVDAVRLERRVRYSTNSISGANVEDKSKWPSRSVVDTYDHGRGPFWLRLECGHDVTYEPMASAKPGYFGLHIKVPKRKKCRQCFYEDQKARLEQLKLSAFTRI
jgi:hypothetical protein